MNNFTTSQVFDRTKGFMMLAGMDAALRTAAEIDPQLACKLYMAISDYAMLNVSPNFTDCPMLQISWAGLEPMIDASIANRKKHFKDDQPDARAEAVIAACVQNPSLSDRELERVTGVPKTTARRIREKYHAEIEHRSADTCTDICTDTCTNTNSGPDHRTTPDNKEVRSASGDNSVIHSGNVIDELNRMNNSCSLSGEDDLQINRPVYRVDGWRSRGTTSFKEIVAYHQRGEELEKILAENDNAWINTKGWGNVFNKYPQVNMGDIGYIPTLFYIPDCVRKISWELYNPNTEYPFEYTAGDYTVQPWPSSTPSTDAEDTIPRPWENTFSDLSDDDGELPF